MLINMYSIKKVVVLVSPISSKPGMVRGLLIAQQDQGVDNAGRGVHLGRPQPLAEVELEPPSCIVDRSLVADGSTRVGQEPPEVVPRHPGLRLGKSLALARTVHQFGSAVLVAVPPRREQYVRHRELERGLKF